MDIHKKNILLQNCNSFETSQIIDILKTGEINIEEFKTAGLNPNTILQVINLMASKVEAEKIANRKKEEVQNNAERKTKLLDKIISGKVSADEIKANLNNGYSFDDLLDAGISSRIVNSLKYYCNSNRITMFKNINQLPPMEEGRTDVYFVGVPGSGKSTMLAGLLNVANNDGILIPDPEKNNAGAIYQTQLISDLKRGVLPNATASGSYNYVALSLKDENDANHPFNIVEVPGENYVNMFNNGDVGEFLNYISNNNKKILIFVIDSLAHDTGYNDSNSQLDQNLVYVNILNMFKSNGILEQTDAIYLVANKFDAIKESRYSNNNSSNDSLALDFLQNEFKALINNCKYARDDSKNKFKIKVLPFSIGNVSYTSIIDNFNKEFSSVVVNNLIEDSFVVKGSRFKLFR